MNPPKLLHIAGPSKFGGDSVLILEMARAAQRRGFKVDVLASDERFQEMIVDNGIGLVNLDVIRREIRPLADLRAVWTLRRALRRGGYSVVHTHTSKPGVVGRLAARLARVPVVVHTVHLYGFHEESGRLATLAYSTIERVAAHWCDAIVTVSEHHRAVSLEHHIGRPEQVVAIPNGVPGHRTRSNRPAGELRRELALDEHDIVVVSTGRLAEQKGLEHLVRALPRIVSKNRVVVLLAGDGPLHDELATLAGSLGVADQVRFLGFRSDIGDLLDLADIVALPSLWEGLSISLIEAMEAGRAVVATTIPSNREVTDDGRVAVLVPPKDADALAAAISRLADDPAARAELGAQARTITQGRYTMERMLDAYLGLYDRLLASRGIDVSAAPAGGATEAEPVRTLEAR